MTKPVSDIMLANLEFYHNLSDAIGKQFATSHTILRNMINGVHEIPPTSHKGARGGKLMLILKIFRFNCYTPTIRRSLLSAL